MIWRLILKPLIICSIHVILVDDDENILEKYLPNDLKHQHTHIVINLK